MRKMVMGCAVAALIALSPKSEARPPASVPFDAPLVTRDKCQVGIASWYGEEFEGSPTASGEPFDSTSLTAAHRILPLGTRIKVTNLRNQKTLILRVNDRGPNIAGRFLDVSKRAAERLGFLGAGLASVRVEVVSFPRGYLTRMPDLAAYWATAN